MRVPIIRTTDSWVRQGYAWANNPNPPIDAPYHPYGLYQFNSAGSTVEISRLATGYYQVLFPGLNGIPNADYKDQAGVLVTAYGDNSHICAIGEGFAIGEGSSDSDSFGNDARVIVSCRDVDGNAVNSRFTVSIMPGTWGGLQ